VLPRHVFRELVRTSGAALAIFAALLLAFLAGRLLRDDASLGALARLLPGLLPLVSPEAMPGAVITGILVTYGRLVSDREYLAAQAGGVHPLWLAAPAGVVALLAVFLAVFLHEFALEPAVNRNIGLLVEDQKNMLDRKLGRPGSLTLAAGGQPLALCRLPAMAGSADRRQAGIEMVGFVPAGRGAARLDAGAVWDPAYPWPSRRIVARHHTRGPVARDQNRQLWVDLRVRQAQYWDYPGGRLLAMASPSAAESGSVPLGADPGREGPIQKGNLAYASMSTLARERRALAETLERHEGELERLLASPEPPAPAVSAARQARDRTARRWREATAALHWKLALASACLGFAFLGVPMGLATHRTGVAATGFMMGVGAAVAFYVAMKVLGRQVESGALGWPWMWLPNLLLVAGGLFFVGRARRRAL